MNEMNISKYLKIQTRDGEGVMTLELNQVQLPEVEGVDDQCLTPSEKKKKNYLIFYAKYCLNSGYKAQHLTPH